MMPRGCPRRAIKFGSVRKVWKPFACQARTTKVSAQRIQLMPIEFTIDSKAGYFVSRYFGNVTDEELIPAWAEFFEQGGWTPGLNELADLSQADLAAVTTDGVRQLAVFTESAYQKRNIVSVLVAVYAPDPLPFGLARVYDAIAVDSPESLRIFKLRTDAERWLSNRGNDTEPCA